MTPSEVATQPSPPGTARAALRRVPPGSRFLWLVAALFAAACPDDCPGNGPEPPPISITLLPKDVTVLASVPTSFSLSAVLWELPGTLRVPDTVPHNIDWSPNAAWITVPVASSLLRERPITVAAATLPTPETGDVVASVSFTNAAPAVSNPTHVTRVGAGWTGDRIVATHVTDAPPSVALITGAAACAQDQVLAFVGAAAIANRVGPCAEGSRAVVASPNRSFVVRDVPWSPAPDVVNVVADQGTGPVMIPIKVWVTIDDASLDVAELSALRDSVREFAAADLYRAEEVFRRERTGLTLGIVGEGLGPKSLADPLLTFADVATRVHVLAPDGQSNVTGDGCTFADGVSTSAIFLIDTLNVYYVQTVAGTMRAETCAHNENRNEEVIYVGWNDRSPTTLVHELGHALGLRFPHGGHARFEIGLANTNVMARQYDPTTPVDRHRLMLGQTFRMSVDSASWTNLSRARPAAAPKLACQCQPNTRSPCPRLAEDLETPAEANDPVDKRDCGDRFRVYGTGSADDGFAMTRGRLYHSGACSDDVMAASDHEWGQHLAIFVVSNFAGKGSCANWVAVWLHGKAAIFRATGDVWNEEPNVHKIEDAIADPVVTKVRVWVNRTLDLADAHWDAQQAELAFGARPTGVSLEIIVEPPAAPITRVNPTCALSGIPWNDASKEIHVYYVFGGALAPPLGNGCYERDPANGYKDVIVINTKPPGYGHRALSHFLGRALGLEDNVPTAGWGLVNLMLPAGTEYKLTLGQLFWINVSSGSWLNRSGVRPGAILDCEGTDRAKCASAASDYP